MKQLLRNEPPCSFLLRFYVIFVLGLFLSQGVTHAQNLHSGCASDVVRKEMSRKNPSLFEKEKQVNERIAQLTYSRSNMRLEDAPVCKIPVVFHIISPTTDMNAFMTETELERRITNTLTWLNAAFSGQSPYAGVNTNIQFVRAQQTKNFLYTPGYTRGNHVLSDLNSPSVGITTTDDQLINYIIGQNGGTLANYFYPNDKYLNVIIVNDIKVPGGATPAGYAYLPLGNSVLEDAIVVKKQFFGTTPEDNVTMIHEAGHYLGLYHTFQNCLNGVCPATEVLTCVNNDCTKDGDMVCDTPPDATNSPSASCTPSNSCNTDATADPGGKNTLTTDVNDLLENYMDYGGVLCKNAFTQGQADRMNKYITDSRQGLCNSIGTQSLCAKPLLSYDFSIVPTNNQFLITPSLVFVNSADTKVGYYYEVNFGDGTPIATYDANTTPSFSHTFPSASTYFVTVTLQFKATGASSYSPECKRILTKSAAANCPNAPTFTASKTTAAVNEIVTFTNTTVCPAGNTCTYKWLVNGAVIPSNTASFPVAGVQMVQLELTTGGCTSKSSGTAIQVGGSSCPDKRYWNIMSGNQMISLSADGFSTKPLPGSPIVRDEASAMISDRDGNMLLFTDGKNVYGADFNIINSGSNVFSGTSSNQGAMILQNPDPSKKNIYYIFSAPETWGAPPYSLGGYKYITVDLSQGNMYNGKTTGKVISGPISLNSALGTEKMVAISKPDGSGYYLITHSTNSNAFITYEITGNGVVNTNGTATQGATIHQNDGSENSSSMILSPSGSMLAISYGTTKKVEIYAFNRQTGAISLQRSISTSFLSGTQNQYYLQFSPDETKLYVNSYSSYTMYQYDLGTSSFSSYTFPFKVGGHLFILPNGKIIGTDLYGSDYIINVPNATLNGNVCMVTPTDYITTSSFCGISEVPILTYNNVIYKIVGSECINAPSSGVNYALSYTPNPYDSFKWTIKQGMPSIASIVGADNGASVNVDFSSTIGTIELQCTITGACGNTVLSKIIKTSSVSPITGTFSFCTGAVSTLSSTTTGGTWTSSNTSVATVVAATGVVTGVAAGTSTITYTATVNGCISTKTQVVTVKALPTVAAITGTSTVCSGKTTTLASTTTGGTWTSSNTAVATVVSTTGVVTGVAAGTSTITYSVTVNGCTSTKAQVVTVTASPTVSAITGILNVCQGLTTTLANTTANGSWTSSNTAVATVSSSGVVTGVAAGTATIKYTVTANGCSSVASATVTVGATPSLPSIYGMASACVGETVTTTVNYGAGNSYFSYTKPVLLNVGGTGFQGGFVEWGEATVSGNFVLTVQNASGCKRSVTSALTVNPLPPVSPITGNTTVCTGRTTVLANATAGGTWTSSNTAVATVNTTGSVIGVGPGTTEITYTINNGTCSNKATTLVTVPDAPVGATFANAINITSNMSCGFTYSNTQNTATNCFVHNVGRPGPEVVYSFTLTTPMNVTFSTCQSGVADTWLTLMNSSMVTLATNDDYGVVCPTSMKASLTQANLAAGTYYIVAEGYNQGYTGSITLDVSATCNNGMYFDGVDDYVTIPIANALPSNSTADAKFTVQVTFNPDNTGSNAMYLLSMQNYSLNNYFAEYSRAGLFKQLDNKFGASFFFPGIEGNTGIPSGTCTSIRTTSPNTPGDRFYVGSFYINGVLYSQPRTANPLSNSIERILIGTDLQSIENPSFGTGYFKGSISEIRIWGNTPVLNTVLTGNEPGLLGYWKLNETSGQTILDYSPYGNHGYRGSTPAVDVNDPGFGPICPYVNNRLEEETSVASTFHSPVSYFAPVVSPNPFSSETTVSFESVPTLYSSVHIEVKDVQGKTVYTKENHPISQSVSVGNNLAQGVYFVEINGLDSPYNFKIVKR